MDMQMLMYETNTYWAIRRDIRAAEKAGDVAEQEHLHAELDCLAMHAESPSLRALAGKAVNRELAENVYRRGASD